MKFIDFFAGVGGFRHGLELSGHKCVGFCEWDKYPVFSYTSMHLMTEEQRKSFESMNLRQRQKEILKDEYRNEWYANDIRNVDARSLPEADCWTFGAPCQDFSVAGKRKGLEGDRSALVREIFRLLEEQEEQDRPEWLIYENVKGMLSSNNGLDYLQILSKMDRLGYDIQWQNMHTEWYLPQHRERIYTVGHLRGKGRPEIFPIKGSDGKNKVYQLGQLYGSEKEKNPSGGRVYGEKGICTTLGAGHGMSQPQVGIICNTNPSGRGMNGNVYDSNGLNPTLTTNKGEGNKVAVQIKDDFLLSGNNFNQRKVVHGNGSISRTVIGCGHSGNEPKVAVPVIDVGHLDKTQNGRRFKENGDPMFTLTAQDRHGVAISPLGCLRTVRTDYGKKIRKDYESGKLKISRHKFLKYEIKNDGCCNTLSTVEKDNYIAVGVNADRKHDGIYVEMPGGFLAYCVWYEKYQCYIAIRRLTPKECFRLQGWQDEYFERAALVNSDSQLYKQAGNGVSVPVVKAIGDKIAEFERKRFEESMNKPERNE